MNRNLKAKDYVSPLGEVKLTKLTDDAVEILEDIHYNGIQKARSRSRFLGKVIGILEGAGWTYGQARNHVHDQILPIFELNIHAEAGE